MITLSAVTKLYHEGQPNAFAALSDIDLTIARHATTVLRGPSGSGKTTLLKIIGCLTRPTSGRVHVDGAQVSGLPEQFQTALRRTTFGFIFQNYQLLRGMSVLDNVMLPAYPLAPSHAALKARALARLDMLDLAGKAHEPVEHLSGGEAQRTAIARALINDPAIIIADEPTANLDSALTARFLDIVALLRAQGHMVLMSSHDPRIWQAEIVDRVITLEDGRICGDEA